MDANGEVKAGERLAPLLPAALPLVSIRFNPLRISNVILR